MRPQFNFKHFCKNADEIALNIKQRGLLPKDAASLATGEHADIHRVVALYLEFLQQKKDDVTLRTVRNEIAALMKQCMSLRGKKPTDTTKTEGELLQLRTQVKSLLEGLHGMSAIVKQNEADDKGTVPLVNAVDATAGEGLDGVVSLLKQMGTAVKYRIVELESNLVRLQSVLDHEAAKIPNDTREGAPIGDQSKARVLEIVMGKGNWELMEMDEEVRKKEDGPYSRSSTTTTTTAVPAGLPRHPNNSSFAPQKARDHVELGALHDWFDFNAGVRIAGRGFWVYKHEAALLEIALVQWALQKLVLKGFVPYSGPDIAKIALAEACGFRPRPTASPASTPASSGSAAEESHLASQMYCLANTRPALCLSATAEIPLAGLLLDQIFPESALPLRSVSFGRAFRVEAEQNQSHGIYRGHQFSKVEMFMTCTAGDSLRLFEELVGLQKEIFSDLGLCFRVIEMPTEELGASAFQKVWCFFLFRCGHVFFLRGVRGRGQCYWRVLYAYMSIYLVDPFLFLSLFFLCALLFVVLILLYWFVLLCFVLCEHSVIARLGW